MRKKNQNGYTMVEIVLAIFLLSLALPPMMQVFSESILTVAGSHQIPAASNLAADLMEEVIASRFDELTVQDANGNWSTTLGADAGEGTNKVNYDDVDDFDGWTQDFGASFPGVTASVQVDYVGWNDLTTALTIPSPVPADWTPSYKRVIVTVTSTGLAGPVQLETIITEAQAL